MMVRFGKGVNDQGTGELPGTWIGGSVGAMGQSSNGREGWFMRHGLLGNEGRLQSTVGAAE